MKLPSLAGALRSPRHVAHTGYGKRRSWKASLTDWPEWRATLRQLAILGLCFGVVVFLGVALDRLLGWSELPAQAQEAVMERLWTVSWEWTFDHWQFWLLLGLGLTISSKLSDLIASVGAVEAELREIKDRLPEVDDD